MIYVIVLMNWLQSLRPAAGYQTATSEEGQGLVEYALILVMVALAAVVTLGALGAVLGELFTNIVERIRDIWD
jgi:pilus assembly protein Flp/PilA